MLDKVRLDSQSSLKTLFISQFPIFIFVNCINRMDAGFFSIAVHTLVWSTAISKCRYFYQTQILNNVTQCTQKNDSLIKLALL